MIHYKAVSFIKKDFRIQISYKVAFILTIIGALFPIISYYFIGELMQGHHPVSLEKYGDDYFSFVLIGTSFASYFTLAINTFSTSIRRAQMAGCLEATLGSQTDPKTIVFLSSLYSFFFALVVLIISFLVASTLLGFSFSSINIISCIVSLILSLSVFISLGVLSASFTIVYKQGDPIQAIFTALSTLLGGALFPVALLPGWLKVISYIIPITHSLEAMRLSILQGYTVSQLSEQLIILGGAGLILLPFSLKVFEWSVEKGKRNGTLISY